MMKLDLVDLKILQILQKEGKVRNSEIATRLKLVDSTVSERIKKLENNHYILGYHADVNKDEFGLNYSAIINISISREKNGLIASFLEKIEKIDEIVECYRVIGKYDFVLRVVTYSPETFERLLDEQFGKMREIKKMEAQNILSIPKKSHVLPLECNESLI